MSRRWQRRIASWWLVGMILALFLSVGLSVVGCASQRLTALYSRMDARVGTLSYDDAIQQFGPPTAMAEGDGVLVADWTATQPSSYLTYGGVSVPVGDHGERMRLIFSRETRLLTAWKHDHW